jgi:hypothetical protein|tara:strand:- start:77 stop:283 length:207 start_codon:yes stop_codon:yes gene_type:complete
MARSPERTGNSGRRAAFLQRMGKMPGPEKRDGKPTPLLMALRDWGASSKADAVRKGKRISRINANKKT